MGTGTDTERTDTRDMLVVHTAFRREFGLAPSVVRGVADGDTLRAVVVGDHLRLLTTFLHLHHGGEDRLLWPRLQQRVPAQLAPVVALMERQHDQIDALVGSLDAPVGRWRDTASAADRDRVAATLADLDACLTEHLAAEELHILPLAARHTSQAEWDELAEEVKAIPLPKLPVAFGMLMYEGDPEVVANILAGAPAPARLILPRVAPRAYARYARRVYGTATP